jgi:hypothetical protein
LKKLSHIINKINEDAFGKDLEKKIINDILFHKCSFYNCISFLTNVGEFENGRGLCTSTLSGSEKLAEGQFCIVFKKEKRKGLYDTKDTDAGKYFGYDEFRTTDKITKEYIDYIVFEKDMYKFYDILVNKFYVPLDKFDYDMSKDDFKDLIHSENHNSIKINDADILFLYKMITYIYDELNINVEALQIIFDEFDEYEGKFGDIEIVSDSTYSDDFINIYN